MRSLPLVVLLPFATAQSPCCDLSPIDGIAQAALAALSAPGICIQVNQHGAPEFHNAQVFAGREDLRVVESHES
jgi:hypothetical protein